MRPTYENEHTLQVEASQKERIEEHTGAKLYKLPIKMFVDFAAVRNEDVIAYIEARARNNSLWRYNDVMTSFAKVWHGVSLAELADVPFYLCYRFTDGDYFIECDKVYVQRLPVRMMKLTSRGDWQDVEPAVCLPPEDFVRF